MSDRDMRDLCLERGQPGELLAIDRAVKRTGGCWRPVRLSGTSRDGGYTTASQPDDVLLVACGTRHATRCAPCASVYRGDARQVVLAGLIGGKGVPESVRDHPAVLVTLTAPSYGPVHSVRSGPCHLGPPGRCAHGRSMHCLEHHDPSEDIFGAPLCPDCFDAEGTVLFNANVSELWRRTMIYSFRHLAYLLGVSEKALKTEVRLAFAKVVEFQRRGAVHIHAVVRADAAGDQLAPPTGVTAQDLVAAILRGARLVSVTREIGGQSRTFRFGPQLRVDVLDHAHAEKIAGYVSKYVTKATDSAGVLDHRLREGELEVLDIPEHARSLLAAAWRLGAHKEHVRLRRWAHAYCFAGHIATKSHRWSTTMSALRHARREWRLAQQGVTEETAGTTIWVCEGVGHRFEIDHSLATTYAEVQRKGREQAWFARTTLGWSVS